jgi:hypothetical protein
LSTRFGLVNLSTEVFAHLPVHETVQILPEEVMQFGTNNLTLVGNSSFSGGLKLATGATGILGIVSDTALGTGALTVNETATLATFGEMRSIANDVVLASGKTLILGAANGDLLIWKLHRRNHFRAA